MVRLSWDSRTVDRIDIRRGHVIVNAIGIAHEEIAHHFFIAAKAFESLCVQRAGKAHTTNLAAI